MAPLKRKGGAGAIQEAGRAGPATRSNVTKQTDTTDTGDTIVVQNVTDSITLKVAKPTVRASTFLENTPSDPSTSKAQPSQTVSKATLKVPPKPLSKDLPKAVSKPPSKTRAMPATTTRARVPSLSPALTSSTSKSKPSPLERNIDNVVFGDVLFRAWYPSRHAKEIVGREVADGKEMLERLYVCKHCFKYSKELMMWVGHVKACSRRQGGGEAMIPGKGIYTHGDSGWGIWEVDGEVDKLYCQNLCLFAKLFLDKKSVFFDVTGFLYYLLVHTSPTTGEQQVVGFFSKEKMSWDNNNLACILIFPPWQRKGLGSLLIGVSYEISRREKIMGGPEKPISDLGKMGYNRYWSGEVARWLLDVQEMDKKTKETVTVGEISKGTWVCVDDCLTALRHMNVAIAAGKGKGEAQKVRIDKEAVREWARTTKTSLMPVIDPEGFLSGYGYRDNDDDDVDEEMGE